ncbi:phosphotransferase family protein [Amphiplicatus metriothermophilus]|uniref:Predicted kinase, aminoglycoside phosphotransferase (APT) family n=1 Tax=Amphiplicatus metriothermophilus TaxID=1519374 RepID=A0A239PLP8_9PROT|nr:phosphotransferase family protein [Amphiplicatus metriothermophilus]MBB5517402.1 aminoglycoside phosphotransferase (APT) family kinase protein [Amphiplicatus metriothermophilus]SNT68263.1 Predicted kinase, aminoglycoside phosphotransferase (APT) family [Amphiplicatus metriothermophilus]
MTNDPQADFSGVGETPEHLKIDEAALEAYMRAHVDGFEGPVAVQKFKGGQSNPTYLATTPAKKYVLRRKPPGKLLPSAHAVEREYRVMTALHAQGFPAPKTYALCEDPDVLGTAFFIMDYVEGRIFWDSSLPDVAREERAPLFHALIDTLADLHAVDYEKAGLSDFGKPGNYFERQIGRWSKQYKAAETQPIPDMDRLIEWLPTAIPDDDAVSIVHGDFRFDNVIMHPDAPKVLAVLDWELSTLGHPLADFTYFLMVWRFPPSVRGGLAGLDLEALGVPGLEDAVARYCARTGRAGLPDLDFCMAYNMFRLASIAQGVYARALQGNASSERAASLGAQVAPLAALAWRHAQKAGA